jgi:hypothetical protein
VSILDEKTAVRSYFPAVRSLYEPYVNGFLLGDNRRSPRKTDVGVAVLAAASTVSSFVAETPMSSANALASIFNKEQGHMYATMSVFGETLPVYRLPAVGKRLPQVFYSKAAMLEEKLIWGAKTLVEHPELQSIPVEPSALGSTRLLLGVAPVVPTYLQVSALRVSEALHDWRTELDPDLLPQFASVGYHLSPDTVEAPVFVVMVQPIAADGDTIDKLACGDLPIAPKFLPAPTMPKLTPVGLPGSQRASVTQEEAD